MLGKLAEFLIFGMTPLLVGMMAVPTLATADETLVTGEVLYRERIALPANAVLEVQLADVSLADAPAKILGAQKIDPAGQVPIRFAIPFDPTAIKTNMTYALQARISVDDQLWFINDVRHSLDPLTAGPQTIVVKMVRQSGAAEELTIFDRDWVAEEIDGAAAHDKAKATLRIATDGKVSGRGGCNGFGGNAALKGRTIRFSRMVSTMMACAPDAMAQEHGFLDGLAKIRRWDIDRGSGLLALLDGRGRPVMTLAQQ